MPRLSVLDLAFICETSTPTHALRNSLDLARHVEQLGYHRFWLAEHHNMIGIASAATAVAICYVAGGTKSIRVGAGGIMLPNHAPLVVAEQFGTLESLFPGRIDLGLGRAPGTDQLTLRALRRSPGDAEHFPQDVMELLHYLGPVRPGQQIRAVPGAETNVPIWILGSSLFGARLAAKMGLPYAFASHFAPTALYQALDIYRHEFTPSEYLAEPYAAAGVNVFAADDDESARRLFTSAQQQFTNLFRGRPGRLQPPIENIESYWNELEKVRASEMLSASFVGAPERVEADLQEFVDQTGVDELIVASAIYDHKARKHSYQLLAHNVSIVDPPETAKP